MTDHDRIGKTLTFPGEAEPVQHETTMAQPGDGVYIPQHESAYDPIKLARDALRQARIALYVRADTIARLTADNDRLRRERDAALAGAVEVRPLVWSPVESWKQCSRERAPAFGGEYQIVMLDPGEDELPSLYFEIGLGAFMFRFEQDQDPMGLPGETCPRKFPSVEAAKAAAQADYRARILTALHPSPDALAAQTEEAANG